MAHWRDSEPKQPHPPTCVYCRANLPHERAVSATDCARLDIANPMQDTPKGTDHGHV